VRGRFQFASVDQIYLTPFLRERGVRKREKVPRKGEEGGQVFGFFVTACFTSWVKKERKEGKERGRKERKGDGNDSHFWLSLYLRSPPRAGDGGEKKKKKKATQTAGTRISPTRKQRREEKRKRTKN